MTPTYDYYKMIRLNARLTAFFFIFWLSAAVSWAQPQPPAMPVEAVTAEQLPNPDMPVVVELYSSQACIFCPQADRLFAEIAALPNVIGIACHVDYFDVGEGALSQPFCTRRQRWYMHAMRAGPLYTPQIIMNGHLDAIGYKFDEVVATLHKAGTGTVGRLPIERVDEDGFALTIPDDYAEQAPEGYHLNVFVLRVPQDLVITGGAYRGQPARYVRVAAALETMVLQRHETGRVRMEVTSAAGHEGLVALLQDAQSGLVYAAGTYQFDPPAIENGHDQATDGPDEDAFNGDAFNDAVNERRDDEAAANGDAGQD